MLGGKPRNPAQTIWSWGSPQSSSRSGARRKRLRQDLPVEQRAAEKTTASEFIATADHDPVVLTGPGSIMEKLAKEEAEKKRGLTDAILQDPPAQAMADAGRLSIVTMGDRPQVAQPPSAPGDGLQEAEGPCSGLCGQGKGGSRAETGAVGSRRARHQCGPRLSHAHERKPRPQLDAATPDAPAFAAMGDETLYRGHKDPGVGQLAAEISERQDGDKDTVAAERRPRKGEGARFRLNPSPSSCGSESSPT